MLTFAPSPESSAAIAAIADDVIGDLIAAFDREQQKQHVKELYAAYSAARKPVVAKRQMAASARTYPK